MEVIELNRKFYSQDKLNASTKEQNMCKGYHLPRRVRSGQQFSLAGHRPAEEDLKPVSQKDFIAGEANEPNEEHGLHSHGGHENEKRSSESSSIFGPENEKMLSRSDKQSSR